MVLLRAPLSYILISFISVGVYPNITNGQLPVDTGHKLNVHKTFIRRPGRLLNVLCKLIFFPSGFFLSRTFTIHRTSGEGRGYLFDSSLPLPSASQTLRHYPGDYCREITSAHSQQPDSSQEPLVPGTWAQVANHWATRMFNLSPVSTVMCRVSWLCEKIM